MTSGWWMGATVAHRMRARAPRFGVRYQSRCGLAFEASLRPAHDGIRRCLHCLAYPGAETSEEQQP